MEKQYNIAVVGATGSVGHQLLTTLDDRKFPVKEIYPVASNNSVGKKVSFANNTLSVISIKDLDFANIDIVFFCAGSNVAKEYAPLASAKGCIIIDKSSYFRLQEDVPLIVPEANIHHLKKFKSGIIANPNCCTIPLAVALKPLDNACKIKRLVISTYQSASGAGKEAMDELYNQTKAKYVYENIQPKVFPTQIAFNLFPHIGDFREDGYSEEEYKITEELKKIIGSHISLTVTCTRVPVFVSHSMSVNVEFEYDTNATEIDELLRQEDGIIVYNHENEVKYPTPVEITEHDEVFVARIRNDLSQKNTVNLWVASDNLRKGAALNAVQIAEEIIAK